MVLEGLNKQQPQAVTTTEWPIPIIAGAGNGKTKVVAHRVARLVNSKKDISPSNTLALIFLIIFLDPSFRPILKKE